MADFEEHLFSSQPSCLDVEQTETGIDIASSPLAAPTHKKMKKPPTITPKRFTRFFTPRQTTRSSNTPSKSTRQLRDITKNAVNRRKKAVEGKIVEVQEVGKDSQEHRDKRRRVLPSPGSSPILSSPSKHNGDVPALIPIFEDDTLGLGLSDLEDDDVHSGIQPRPYPRAIERVRSSTASQRLLQRTFGGHRATGRGRIQDHCTDWRASTAPFYSGSNDCHSFQGEPLPFCTAACNSNSLIAIGDEEGGISLIDSSSSEGIEFGKKHVSFRPHRNAVMDIAFSSDDYLFASASGDQTARVIDMRTQQTRYIMAGHMSSVKQVRFQPGNDSILATSSRDGSVQLWDLRCRGSDAPIKKLHVDLDGDASTGSTSTERKVIYAQSCISIREAHGSTPQNRANLFGAKPAPTVSRPDVSITALSFLPTGREHLLLTASEANASIKLWDIRAKHTSRRGTTLPVSSTPQPDTHSRHRQFGVSSLALSGNGSRLYSLCKDSTVYVYSTNHLILGQAPELSDATPRLRRAVQDTRTGLGPLYGFRHAQLKATSFYVKAAIRPAKGGSCEMLAVGSRDGAPMLFPTDETHLLRKAASSKRDDDDDGLPKLPTRPSLQRLSSGLVGPDTIPIYSQGTALVNGHASEVTGLTWTAEGELITVGDDFRARCWREGPRARDLRLGGEAEGRRWGCGWADVSKDYDDDDD